MIKFNRDTLVNMIIEKDPSLKRYTRYLEYSLFNACLDTWKDFLKWEHTTWINGYNDRLLMRKVVNAIDKVKYDMFMNNDNLVKDYGLNPGERFVIHFNGITHSKILECSQEMIRINC